MWFHWQNLNKKADGSTGWGLRNGRCWWHFEKGCIGLEWVIPSKRCAIGFETGAGDSDQGWELNVGIPLLFSLFLTLDFKLPVQTVTVPCYDKPGETWQMPVCRVFRLYWHEWAIWFTPWGRGCEWHSRDPWWVRGIVFDVGDFFLGKTRYSTEALKIVPITVNLPEGSYDGTATLKRRTWKRPRWFARTRLDWIAQMPRPGHGLPFPGKGENSWDCGMDGLYGWGCESRNGDDVERLIAKGVEAVMKKRRRYGGSVKWVPETEATGGAAS